MKKILFLIHDLGHGGAEKVLVNLVNNMDRTKFDISVTINGRLTTTLGRCRSRKVNEEEILPFEIQFSKKFLESSPDTDIIAVIQHEWAHYYATKSTKEPHGHDNYFKDICARIGCQNDQRQFKGIAPNETERRFKYEVHCDKCNKVVATYNRMCATLKNLDFCSCPICGSRRLWYRQNW